jgi:hypothetical protein
MDNSDNKDNTMASKNPEDSEEIGNDEIDHVLNDQVFKLSLDNNDDDDAPLIICDAGYGLPRQARPRKEKISAISKQLYNFIQWQMKNHDTKHQLARIKVVGTSDVICCVNERLLQLWDSSTLPKHVEFISQTLECLDLNEAVYLSPDATNTLDASKQPPRVTIVGLLIDRRIQPNRSMNRATSLDITAARWPLEDFFSNIDSQEPLNVDTIMEGMQEWYWNCNRGDMRNEECFVQAAASAMERHAQRHPNRPLHKVSKTSDET